MATIFDGNVQVIGTLDASGGVTGVNRSGINEQTDQVYPIPLNEWGIWDSENWLTSPGSDDLGLSAIAVTGTFGTGVKVISSGTLNAIGAFTRYARATFTLPPEYVAGAAVSIRFSAGMFTAVASVSANVDAEIYVSDRDGTVGGSDLVTTAQQSINSLTWANKTFVLTSSGLAPGHCLDIRIQLNGNSATPSAHYAMISNVDMLLTVRG